MKACGALLLLLLLDILSSLPGVEVAGTAPSYNLLVVQSGNVRRPFSIRFIRPAVQLAVQTARDVFNINFSIPEANFVDDGPTSACAYIDVGPALGLSSRHLTRLKKLGTPFFFIAPFCSTDMAAVAMLSVAHNVMTFTGFAPEIQYMLGMSSAVSRIGYSVKSSMQSILQMCLKFDWTNIAVIWYQWDPNNATDVQIAAFQHEGRMSNLEQLIMQTNRNRPNKVKLTNIIHNNFVKDANDTLQNLWKASNTSRVIVFLTNNDVLRRYMIEAYYQGYSSGGYVFIAVDVFQTAIINDPMMVGSAMAINSNWTTGYPDNTTAYVEAMKSLLVVTMEMYGDDPSRKAWLARLLSKNPTLPAKPGLDQAAFMANAYDSVIILAYALRQHLNNGGTVAPNDAATNGQLSTYFYNQTFNTTKAPISTRHFFIDQQGDKRENYYIYAIQDKSLTTFDKSSYQRVGKWNSATYKLNITHEIVWPGGAVPLNVPLCGYLGSDTSNPSCVSSEAQMKQLLVGLSTSIPLAMLLVASGCFLYRQRREEKRITREWLAQAKDLMVVHPDEEYRARKDKLNKAVKAGIILEQNAALNDGQSMGAHSADGGFGYSMNRDSAGRSAITFHSGGASQYKRGEGMRSDTGFWRKAIVTVRWSHKKHIFMSRKVLREIRQVRALEHDNLCIFAGACIAKDTTVVLYEYCPRGTLQDLINNPAQKFEWTMRIAFLEDILQGLLYLQNSAVGYHGRLTSDCCHIDRRFLMKLSDYGLPSFFSHNMLESWLAKRDAKFLESQLWQAPELVQSNNELTDGPSRSVRHGPELDVYSYGIILQEVILRAPPYSMHTDLDHDAISTYLRIGRRLNDKPLRPFFPPDMVGLADGSLMELAEKCWSENPRERPKLSAIKECVKAAAANMNIKDSGSIMDMLLTQMEQQNARLQAVVEEKGKHILVEKLQAEKVIHACLQKDVAEKLKQHQDISPEAMEIVTILLVQIAQFERILADSTPNQLIDVLNDYNLFIDKAVSRFDCHKIDSELDLITVASGVPNRNGILNAREICRLALTLQYRIRELRFHHRPNDPIKLQMGVHSGPCVSAVVGRMIPRYTLFGDTIEITKRMLSTGTTQKIHISTYTKDVLETFGSFRTEERGEVFVKGKGALTTYWLTGEDGNKELKTLQTKYEASLFLDRDED